MKLYLTSDRELRLEDYMCVYNLNDIINTIKRFAKNRKMVGPQYDSLWNIDEINIPLCKKRECCVLENQFPNEYFIITYRDREY